MSRCFTQLIATWLLLQSFIAAVEFTTRNWNELQVGKDFLIAWEDARHEGVNIDMQRSDPDEESTQVVANITEGNREYETCSPMTWFLLREVMVAFGYHPECHE